MSGRHLLEELLPRYDAAERHRRVVAASPERVWQAIGAVTLRELPLVRGLFALRSLPARLAGGKGLPLAADQPLLGQLWAAGFTRLAEDPGRELVGGVIGQLWKLAGGEAASIRDGAAFTAFGRPGFVKAAMSFWVSAWDGGTLVETETRALATDPVSRRRFVHYWRLIRPGSGAIRRSWLRAADRGATRAAPKTEHLLDGPAGDRGQPPTSQSVARRLWVVLRLTSVVVAAAAASLVALVGVAAVTAGPALFLGAGLAVFLAATGAGAGLATRRVPAGRRRWTRLIGIAVGALVGVVVFVITALVPVADPRLPPAAVAGQAFWELPTGSRIAYVHLPAHGRPRPTPLVFLHGGPGIADMAGDAAYFGQLTGDGYHVYVYDQVGTGRSSRLADPRGYTIAREVDDLEAIRGRIGADRMVLIGHSWGGQVAAAYLAAHPAHVARVVFSSPGALAPATDDGSGGGVKGRLPTMERLRLYRLLVRPRVLLGWTLLQVNPRAAHALVGDAEMDARNDWVYNAGRAGAHCRGLPPGPALHGLGFYAYQFPQSAAARPWPDPRAALARLDTPALVVKGSCDYLSWSYGTDYLRALPGARLVYLHRAGHNAYQDRPAEFLATVRAFLADRPLPIAPWAGTGVPADYEGPAGKAAR
jgi:proline iminopeptidase